MYASERKTARFLPHPIVVPYRLSIDVVMVPWRINVFVQFYRPQMQNFEGGE